LTELLARVRGFFVVPTARPAPRELAPPPPPRLGLLAPAGDALAAGAGLALAAARAVGNRSAVVCLWRGERAATPTARARATRAARSLAGALAGDGIESYATGRLAIALLPADPVQAAAAAIRTSASTIEPVVLAVAGPRSEPIDRLIAAQDAVVQVVPRGEDPTLTALATESLGTHGIHPVACELELGLLTRWCAARGIWPTVPLRRTLAPALERA
jgi:hypothetical protein